jgi:hypothetical protein
MYLKRPIAQRYFYSPNGKNEKRQVVTDRNRRLKNILAVTLKQLTWYIEQSHRVFDYYKARFLLPDSMVAFTS